MSAPDEDLHEEERGTRVDEMTLEDFTDEELAQELAARLVSKAVSHAHIPHNCALTVQAQVPGSLPMSIMLAPGVATSFNWEQLVVMNGEPVRVTVPMVARLSL